MSSFTRVVGDIIEWYAIEGRHIVDKAITHEFISEDLSKGGSSSQLILFITYETADSNLKRLIDFHTPHIVRYETAQSDIERGDIVTHIGTKVKKISSQSERPIGIVISSGEIPNTCNVALLKRTKSICNLYSLIPDHFYYCSSSGELTIDPTCHIIGYSLGSDCLMIIGSSRNSAMS